LEFRDGLTGRYSEIFQTGGGEDYSANGQFSGKWGWYHSVYKAAKGDVRKFESVTKLNMNQVLLYLCYEADKHRVEKAELERKFKK